VRAGGFAPFFTKRGLYFGQIGKHGPEKETMITMYLLPPWTSLRKPRPRGDVQKKEKEVWWGKKIVAGLG